MDANRNLRLELGSYHEINGIHEAKTNEGYAANAKGAADSWNFRQAQIGLDDLSPWFVCFLEGSAFRQARKEGEPDLKEGYPSLTAVFCT